MFLKLLDRHIRHGTLTVVEPGGRRHTFGEGEPSATWVLRKPGTARRILLNPGANLGETYMGEEWDVEDGGLADLLTVLRVNMERNLPGRSIQTLLGPLATIVTSWNTVRASLSNVSHHYDLDEALFRAFLDRDMHYSCAYFREPDLSLEAAQAAKCAHIRRKLNLSPGQRVLDIGCGWGSLAMHLAERSGVEVVGLTLSAEQLRAARAEAERRGLADRVAFRLEDYRQHRAEYDAVVSVGMFEHVGRRNSPRTSRRCGSSWRRTAWRCCTPSGNPRRRRRPTRGSASTSSPAVTSRRPRRSCRRRSRPASSCRTSKCGGGTTH